MTRYAKAPGAGMIALHLLMELLAIPLSNQKTVAKWLVIPQSAGYAITSLRVLLGLQPLTTTAYPLRVYLARVVFSPSRMASSFISNVPARGRPMGSPLLRSDPFALSEVQS